MKAVVLISHSRAPAIVVTCSLSGKTILLQVSEKTRDRFSKEEIEKMLNVISLRLND